jgi:nucleoid-associated protein YgaU
MASLEQLKAKYQSVIDLAKARGVHLTHVHVENEKLQISGEAPNDGIKNEVWNQIKAVDAAHADIAADITVNPSLPAPAPQQQVYEVVAGDNLSKISKKFYGDANQYQRIFEANRDQLQDPDKIKVGQKLKIPV